MKKVRAAVRKAISKMASDDKALARVVKGVAENHLRHVAYHESDRMHAEQHEARKRASGGSSVSSVDAVQSAAPAGRLSSNQQTATTTPAMHAARITRKE